MSNKIILAFLFFTFLICSCEKQGCTNEKATNYSSNANKYDGSCKFYSDKLLGTYRDTIYSNRKNIGWDTSFYEYNSSGSFKITRFENKYLTTQFNDRDIFMIDGLNQLTGNSSAYGPIDFTSPQFEVVDSSNNLHKVNVDFNLQHDTLFFKGNIRYENTLIEYFQGYGVK